MFYDIKNIKYFLGNIVSQYFLIHIYDDDDEPIHVQTKEKIIFFLDAVKQSPLPSIITCKYYRVFCLLSSFDTCLAFFEKDKIYGGVCYNI